MALELISKRRVYIKVDFTEEGIYTVSWSNWSKHGESQSTQAVSTREKCLVDEKRKASRWWWQKKTGRERERWISATRCGSRWRQNRGRHSHLGTARRSRRWGEAESEWADECVRKPLSRFRQLEKIDHRNPQQGSSKVTAAVFIHTADNKTTVQSKARLLVVSYLHGRSSSLIVKWGLSHLIICYLLFQHQSMCKNRWASHLLFSLCFKN